MILNPRAGHPPPPRRLEEALNWLVVRGWRVEHYETARPMHARDLAAEAAAAGCNVVLACGGDGTINEVVNGLAGSETALAVLPAGTVNIWAREAGIGRRPLDAVHLLEYGEHRRVDLGRAGDRYFLLLASVGIDSYTVYRVTPELKRRWGRYAYVLTGIRALKHHSGWPLAIEVDGRRYRGDTLAAIVANTRLYGGVITAAHHAQMDDGLLDLCAFPGRGVFSLCAHVVETLLGRHDRPNGALYRQAGQIRITSRLPLPVQMDGEHAGLTPMTFACQPACLTVIVAPGARSALFSRAAQA